VTSIYTTGQTATSGPAQYRAPAAAGAARSPSNPTTALMEAQAQAQSAIWLNFETVVSTDPTAKVTRTALERACRARPQGELGQLLRQILAQPALLNAVLGFTKRELLARLGRKALDNFDELKTRAGHNEITWIELVAGDVDFSQMQSATLPGLRYALTHNALFSALAQTVEGKGPVLTKESLVKVAWQGVPSARLPPG